ncbi:MAG: hypothetical protein KatS3mg027_0375 [Bacteroidia bacterium]|nr:MAG: hypothetical protein KatS3mg027_0375 [Bacteroidia bacterium]
MIPKKNSSLHVLLLVAFISLVIILSFLPKTPSNNKPIINVSTIDTSLSLNIELYKQQDKSIEEIISKFQKQQLPIDSLISSAIKKKQPALMAYFEEIKYLNSPIDTVWYYLGKNYYNALGFSSDAAEIEALISSAARCFNKAIALNEKNINSKIMLASCYVQTNNPMLGVQMLKEIEKTDSNNVLLQMQLAEFSIRSNQLDKAIQRYEKAIQLDSNKYEIYAYLSEIYMQKKDTLKSIQFLRKFAAKISDTTLKNSINHYIESINKH